MSDKQKQPKPDKKKQDNHEVLTEQEFLEVLNKVSRRKPKPSRGSGKKRTSE